MDARLPQIGCFQPFNTANIFSPTAKIRQFTETVKVQRPPVAKDIILQTMCFPRFFYGFFDKSVIFVV